MPEPLEPIIGSRLISELAFVDLEQRWRRSYRSGRDVAKSNESFPTLPSWRDYTCRFHLQHDVVDGICYEFRVRQLFGDRPNYEDLMGCYPEQATSLRQRLPAVAAELTRASLRLFRGQTLLFTAPLPPRCEIGRQKQGEPDPPTFVSDGQVCRILVAGSGETHLSRAQFRCVAAAKGRLQIQHCASKGRVDINAQFRLQGQESCYIDLPCWIRFRDWQLLVA
jgi:hypothetical protein